MNGNKTYLVCALAVAATAAHGLGFIDQQVWVSLMVAFGFSGAAAFRHAFKKGK